MKAFCRHSFRLWFSKTCRYNNATLLVLGNYSGRKPNIKPKLHWQSEIPPNPSLTNGYCLQIFEVSSPQQDTHYAHRFPTSLYHFRLPIQALCSDCRPYSLPCCWIVRNIQQIERAGQGKCLFLLLMELITENNLIEN